MVLVSTPYIGVSPEDIESLVTVPLERELKGIKDIKSMTSTSYEGTSLITLEFNPDADISEALQKVRERVDAAKVDLPEDGDQLLRLPDLADLDLRAPGRGGAQAAR